MAAVAAGRWDIEWERGGFWRSRVARRAIGTRVLIGIGPPCLMEVRGLDDPSTEPPLLTLAATIADDHSYAELLATHTQIEGLPRERYQHRIIVGDLVTSEPQVILRGYITINDQVRS